MRMWEIPSLERFSTLKRFTRKASKALLLVATFSISGCGGTPDGLMSPSSLASPDAHQVPIVIATTRQSTENPATLFSGERGKLSYAKVAVSIPPNHVSGQIEWPSSLPVDPNKYFSTQQASLLDQKGFQTAVRQSMKNRKSNGKVFVFIHGYNTRFDAAVYRLAQISYDSGADVAPVLFTWPSRGKLLGYPYDRESAAYSRDALEKLLQDLARDPEVKDITILAHSMGNMAALEALKQMAVRSGNVSGKIRNVILASPDVDVDVAKVLIEGMGSKPPRFTLFISRDDRALGASRLVWGSTDRLGSIDPGKEPYLTALSRYSNMEVFDLTSLQAGDSLNHTKFAQSPDVVRFVGERLMAGQKMDTQTIGIGDHIGSLVIGATTVVGNAATAAVSAPIAIVDPATRENLSDRIHAIVPGAY